MKPLGVNKEQVKKRIPQGYKNTNEILSYILKTFTSILNYILKNIYKHFSI